MTLFSIKEGTISQISEIPFKREKDLQTLVERNLQNIFGFELVATEFELKGLRIDSLCFDKQINAFVIIEYKRNKNFSATDQGLAYHSLVCDNKAETILVYNENLNGSLKKENVDWNNTRVVFVSPMFTAYQQLIIESKDWPIELWEVKQYSNDTISFAKIESRDKSVSVTKEEKKINKIIQKTYPETRKCPKCKKVKNILRDFGFRFFKGKKYVQSQCVECRSHRVNVKD